MISNYHIMEVHNRAQFHLSSKWNCAFSHHFHRNFKVLLILSPKTLYIFSPAYIFEVRRRGDCGWGPYLVEDREHLRPFKSPNKSVQMLHFTFEKT